jgi:hypothetical protein
MNVTARARPAITYAMRVWSIRLALLAVLALGVVACTRERSRTVSEEEAEEAAEGPRDYREMLDRARAKQTSAQMLSVLEDGIQRFQMELARLPTNLAELRNRGFVTEIQNPPPGQAYTYDPVHGNVGLLDVPDNSGIHLPPESTNLAPVRLQDVSQPVTP